jgi:hypothetical protein
MMHISKTRLSLQYWWYCQGRDERLDIIFHLEGKRHGLGVQQWTPMPKVSASKQTGFSRNFSAQLPFPLPLTTRAARCNPYWNTHVFFANSELLIKDYASYLTYTTYVSNYKNHVMLMADTF